MAVKMSEASDTLASGGATLAVFRLIPTAARDDRRFARDALHGEVVVRALSADDARRVAAEAEAEAMGATTGESAFIDPALYTVIAVPGAGFMRPGARGVITGRFASRTGEH